MSLLGGIIGIACLLVLGAAYKWAHLLENGNISSESHGEGQ